MRLINCVLRNQNHDGNIQNQTKQCENNKNVHRNVILEIPFSHGI